MAVQPVGSGSVQGSIDQVASLKSKNLKSKVGFSLKKKSAAIQMSVNKNLLENRPNPNKGSKINIFA